MNIEEKRTRMLEILQETVEFYSEDTSRRAVGSAGCAYRVACDDGEVKKCALGRYIRDEAYHESMEGTSFNLPTACERLGTTFDDILVPEAQGLSMNFWANLQYVHDNKDNWDEDGLSEVGSEWVDLLKKEISRGSHD